MIIIVEFKFLLVQGRALPQEESMQCFPSNWKEEFPLIKKLGFYGIEWIYDKKSETTNPILTETGRNEMIKYSLKNQVSLENIVLDWFITHPLLKNEKFSIDEKIEKLKFLIKSSSKVGFKRVIIPLLEENSITQNDQKIKFIKIFKKISKELDKYDMELHLETSLNPNDEKKLLEEINHPKLRICFDMGNSASYGFEPKKSINYIKNYLGLVHIKDRKVGGASTPLGQGDVNFITVFKTLKEIKFKGPIVFQVYRDNQSDNLELLYNSFTFINNIMVQNGYE
jgi:L-ribulose-5-phosphate 3-epimerase